MSLWSSLSKGLKNTVKGVTQVFSGKNPFSSGGGFNSLLKGAAGDIQDFAEGYTGERMAKKNLEAQKEQWKIQNDLNERQFQYQKDLNDLQMQREDTSYQRKVADMTKAGFNPILATGGSGEPSAPLKAPAQTAPSAPILDDYSGGIRSGIGAIFELLGMRKDFAQKDASIKLMNEQKKDVSAGVALKEAETARTNAEAERIKQETKYGDEYFRLRNQGMQLKNDNQAISNYLDSSTVETKIESARVNLDMDKVKLYNSQLDSELKKLGITRAQIENEILEIDKKYKGNIYEAELLAKTILALKSSAEYSSLMFDIDFYNRQHGLPVGYNLPVLARYSDYASGLISGAWRELKEFVNGRINFSDFYNTVKSCVTNTTDALGDIAKNIGVSKNELIWSFRRPADGVRRNQYSVMFGR